MKGIEISYGAKDSELQEWEYNIPEGYTAEIKDGKVIIKKDKRLSDMTREEALKIVRENYPHFGTTEPWLDLEKALATLIPELRESEDERIRKECISIIKHYGHICEEDGDPCPTIGKCLAYLEKQKEDKWSPSEDEMGVLYKLCYISSQVTDEDDTNLTRLYQDLKRKYFNGHSFENMFPSEKQKDSLHIPETCKEKSKSFTYTFDVPDNDGFLVFTPMDNQTIRKVLKLKKGEGVTLTIRKYENNKI